MVAGWQGRTETLEQLLHRKGIRNMQLEGKNYYYKRKPRICPICKAEKIQDLLLSHNEPLGWNIPDSCSGREPSWQCSNCQMPLYKLSGTSFVRKPSKCPKCGSNKMDTIIYGIDCVTEEQELIFKTRNFIFLNNEKQENDPSWQCKDCEALLYLVEHPSFQRKPEKCPICGEKKIATISYGYPTEEAFKDAEAGKIVLGGCCVSGYDPSWQCTWCHTSF